MLVTPIERARNKQKAIELADELMATTVFRSCDELERAIRLARPRLAERIDHEGGWLEGIVAAWCARPVRP